MSAIFLVVPVITAWPAFTSAVAAVGGVLGYAVHRGKVKKEIEASERTEVELPIKEEKTLAGLLEKEGDFVLTKDDLQLAVSRDARGRCHVKVSGTGRSKAELSTLGSNFFYEVVRQYTYNQVKVELKNQGFAVLSEQKQTDESVQLVVRRWA